MRLRVCAVLSQMNPTPDEEEFFSDTETTMVFDMSEASSTAERSAALFHVFRADQPCSGAQALLLRDVARVRFGRSLTDSIKRERDGTVRMEISDPWMSASHASLTRDNGRWLLEDLGSKNGVYVNGTRREVALVHDEDVIEVGSSFLRLRHAVRIGPSERQGFCGHFAEHASPCSSTPIDIARPEPSMNSPHMFRAQLAWSRPSMPAQFAATHVTKPQQIFA